MARITICDEFPGPTSVIFGGIVDLSKWSAFQGYGPLPGIREATLPEGEQLRLGSRVRVLNTDGTVHHEVVRTFEPHRRYSVVMELSPPASYLMDRIEEDVELSETPTGGTRMTRTFITVPRSVLTAPLVWLLTHGLLRKAVIRHNRLIQRELR